MNAPLPNQKSNGAQAHPAARPRAARSIGAAVWRGDLYLFGGFGFHGTVKEDDVSNDLWRYRDGWQRVCTGGPPAARYPSLTVADDKLLAFGGCGYENRALTFDNDVWLYDGSWSCLAARGVRPAPRYTSALAWHDGCLFVFGGNAQENGPGAYFGDLWRFVDGRWQQVHGPEVGPGRRYGFGWAAGPTSLYVFGGYDGTADLGDFWALNLKTLIWQRLPSGPDDRYCSALGYVNGRVVLFGGRSKVNPKKNFSDTWVFDQTWTQAHGTSPDYHAKSGYASDGAAMWLYGGEGPRGHVSDMWRYETSGWRLVSPARDDDPVLW